MPRSDRTYTDTDVLRIISNHLSAQERQNVLENLLLLPSQPFLPTFLNELSSFIPIVSDILDAASVLGVLFDQADIERSKLAAAGIERRRNQLRRALEGPLDF